MAGLKTSHLSVKMGQPIFTFFIFLLSLLWIHGRPHAAWEPHPRCPAVENVPFHHEVVAFAQQLCAAKGGRYAVASEHEVRTPTQQNLRCRQLMGPHAPSTFVCEIGCRLLGFVCRLPGCRGLSAGCRG